ncbi:MAG: aminopeptidase P family protein [Bacteroidales bacterium]|jgi:Xaa-Pro aminopeptidase|nr:aminopeptidase P family protein [Bacteroidales bacterium]
MFNKEIYIDRRNRLRTQIQQGIVVLLSNNEAPMNYPSNTYHYRQDSSFIYFFGLQLPGLVGVIDLDEGKDILFGDDYTIDDIIWMGNQPTITELGAMCGISYVQKTADLSARIENALLKNRKVHFLPPYRSDNQIFLHKLTGISIDDIKSNASVELIKAVVALRNCKQAEEIIEMDKICDTGVKMHLAAMQNCKAGKIERQLAGLIEGMALSEGNGVSFPVILSQNGETLHNHNHEQTLENGRLLLVDAGAESVSGYSSDYTRTFPVSGQFTTKQKEIYEIVLKANMESIAMAKPGLRYFDVHLNATTIIAKGLTELGLMKGNPVDAAKEGAHALFMPHGLGHMLGLDVHDMEDLGENYVGYDEYTKRSSIFGHASLRCGRELQPGFIVTVEPGIYFIPQLIDLWEKENKFTNYINYNKVREYIGFGGIRIEDDILITQEGCRVLGTPLPKKVTEVEDIMTYNTK